MYNRYQGNTGQVRRVEETHQETHQPQPSRHQPQREQHRHPAPPSPARPKSPMGLMEQLGRLLPGTQEELETEDMILLLILYLMYRESGDSELLMIMGAMFLL